MRYFIRFLLIVMATIAVLAFCAVNLSQTTYASCCVIAPATLALALRHFQKIQPGLVSLIVLGSTTGIGSLLLAYGSYDKTFNDGAIGFLVGDGWNSVAASAVIGMIAGFFCGLISLVLYFVLSAVFGRPLSRAPDRHAG